MRKSIILFKNYNPDTQIGKNFRFNTLKKGLSFYDALKYKKRKGLNYEIVKELDKKKEKEVEKIKVIPINFLFYTKEYFALNYKSELEIKIEKCFWKEENCIIKKGTEIIPNEIFFKRLFFFLNERYNSIKVASVEQKIGHKKYLTNDTPTGTIFIDGDLMLEFDNFYPYYSSKYKNFKMEEIYCLPEKKWELIFEKNFLETNEKIVLKDVAGVKNEIKINEPNILLEIDCKNTALEYISEKVFRTTMIKNAVGGIIDLGKLNAKNTASIINCDVEEIKTLPMQRITINNTQIKNKKSLFLKSKQIGNIDLLNLKNFNLEYPLYYKNNLNIENCKDITIEDIYRSFPIMQGAINMRSNTGLKIGNILNDEKYYTYINLFQNEIISIGDIFCNNILFSDGIYPETINIYEAKSVTFERDYNTKSGKKIINIVGGEGKKGQENLSIIFSLTEKKHFYNFKNIDINVKKANEVLVLLKPNDMKGFIDIPKEFLTSNNNGQVFDMPKWLKTNNININSDKGNNVYTWKEFGG